MQKCTGSRALARHVRSGASRSCFFGPRGGSRLRTSVLLRSLRSTGPPTEARRRARRTGSRALCGNGGAHRAAEGQKARIADAVLLRQRSIIFHICRVSILHHALETRTPLLLQQRVDVVVDAVLRRQATLAQGGARCRGGKEMSMSIVLRRLRLPV